MSIAVDDEVALGSVSALKEIVGVGVGGVEGGGSV